MGILHLPWKTIANEALDRTIPLLKFYCCLHLTSKYICSPAYSTGPSMVPTLSLTGDLLLVDQISTHLGRIKRGDIVIVRSPENPRKVVTKRVTAMEGDQVTFLVDPNEKEEYKTVTVQKGHVWVQGDNIYSSTDSRSFGSVPYGMLCGRVFFRVWPFQSFGLIENRSS